MTGLSPSIQIQGGSVEPFILHVQGRGLTSGLAFEPFETSLQLFEPWFIPNIRLLGDLIVGARVDNRVLPPTFKLLPQEKEKPDVQNLAQKIDKIGAEISRIAKEQRGALFGKNISLTQKVRDHTSRKGLLKQVEDLGVSAQSEKKDIKKMLRQGFEEGEQCCIRQREAIGQVDKKLVRGIDPLVSLADLDQTGAPLLGMANKAKMVVGILLLLNLLFKFIFKNKSKPGKKDTEEQPLVTPYITYTGRNSLRLCVGTAREFSAKGGSF